MAPKKNSTKNKPSKKTPPGGNPPLKEMSKDELKQQIVRLQEELVKVQLEKTRSKEEMEKIQVFWETTKRNLEEVQANLRSKQKEKHDTEERLQVENSVYKQKVNKVLRECCDIVFQAKEEGTASISLIHEEHVQSELELLKEFNELKVGLRKNELVDEQCIKDERLKQELELSQLMNDYDEQVQETEAVFRKKVSRLIELDSTNKASKIKEIEARMNKYIADLLTIHERAFKDAAEEFNSSERTIKRHISKMSTTAEILTVKMNQMDKDVKAALRQKERLHQSQHQSESQLPELHTQLDDYIKVKAELEKVRARTALVKQEREELSVKHQLLRTAFQKLQKERDDMRKKQAEAIEDIQLKNCMENLLKRKAKETLETKEAQLLSTGLPPVQRASGLETKEAEALQRGSTIRQDEEGSSGTVEKEL